MQTSGAQVDALIRELSLICLYSQLERINFLLIQDGAFAFGVQPRIPSCPCSSLSSR